MSRNRNPLLMGVVALCAMGVGITGTMLVMQGRAPQSAAPTPVPIATATASPLAGLPIPGAIPNGGVAPATSSAANSPGAPSAAQASEAQAALARGNEFYDSQQWPRAIEQYRAVIAAGFDNPDVRTDLGNSLRFAGQAQLALDQYKIAHQQDPTHEQSLFNQGGLWAFALDNKPKALQAWREYLKQFPNGKSAKEARTLIKKNTGK